jgi:uncharacterized protein YaaN involved in tellurite resistance
MTNITVTPEATLSVDYLNKIGLKESDLEIAVKVKESLDHNDMLSITKFGGGTANKTMETAEKMLSQVRSKDMDSAGDKLASIITVAKSVNINSLRNKKYSWPLIGQVFEYFDKSKAMVESQFNSANTQIETIIKEVSETKLAIAERNIFLNEAYDSVEAEYYDIGLHIAAGKMAVSEMDKEIAELSIGKLEGLESHKLFDKKNKRERLDKRVSQFVLMQKSAEQSLPQFRITQANNLALIEKFDTINTIVIPSWRRSFIVSLSLKEQEGAVALADIIDKTTNDLLIDNAKLLKQNSIQTAKANQRLSIDISTLHKVQDLLIETVTETTKITAQGKIDRANAEAQCIEMQDNFKSLIINQPETLIESDEAQVH